MALILNGTDGLSDVDGSAATPAIRGTDTNTGIFFPTADTIAFSEGGVESMRLNASGNLLVGTSTQPASGEIRQALVSSGNAYLEFQNTTTNSGATIGTAVGGMLFYTNTGAVGSEAYTERMRITSDGNLLLNTSTANDVRLAIVGNNQLYGTAEFSSPKGTNNSHIHYGSTGDWYLRPASNSGSVYVKNYVAESDARLKENIEDTPYGLNDILALTPRKFNWINGGDVENNGFIAQEVEEVLPALVSEGQWKSVDYQGITSILVKAIQELKATVDAQETRIAALENQSSSLP
jgi:hypothetical protein